MFKVDRSARLLIPEALSGASADSSFYRYTELVGADPIWLLDVLPLDEEGDQTVYERNRFLVADPREACAILKLELWATRRMYVLFRDEQLYEDRLRLSRCLAVYQCDEPQSHQPCWRIVVEGMTVLYSRVGTELGRELNSRLLWQDQDPRPLN